MTPFQPGAEARATADYQAAYPDPLTVSAGEEVAVGREDTEWVGWVWCMNAAGKGGWLPIHYVERKSDKGKMRFDYTAAELPLQAGETITLHHEESGWYWATNAAGRSGWVPNTHIERIP